MASSLGIANRFLERGIPAGRDFTPMHLQKFCYMAHGYCLALLDDPLIGEAVEAWDYGPVYPELYNALRRYGSRPVPELIHENNWANANHIRGDVVRDEITTEEEEIITDVYEVYGDLNAIQLSNWTHEEGSPWFATYQAGRRGLRISNRVIRDYFRELTQAA